MNEIGWPSAKAMPAPTAPPSAQPLSIDALVQQHTDFIWRVLRRLGLSSTDADDATQQVFMVATRNLHRITDANARAFLYGTAVRVASNARRGLRRQRALHDAHAQPDVEVAAGPDKMLEMRAARDLLDELLSRLPEEQRRVLILVEIEQLELSEVAELESLPSGTVASRLRLARQRFAVLLKSAQSRNPFGRER